MKHVCVQLPPTLGDHEGSELDEAGLRALDEHLRECSTCAEAMKGTMVQRALVRGVFGASAAALAPLPDPLVARLVAKMKQEAAKATKGKNKKRQA